MGERIGGYYGLRLTTRNGETLAAYAPQTAQAQERLQEQIRALPPAKRVLGLAGAILSGEYGFRLLFLRFPLQIMPERPYIPED